MAVLCAGVDGERWGAYGRQKDDALDLEACVQYLSFRASPVADYVVLPHGRVLAHVDAPEGTRVWALLDATLTTSEDLQELARLGLTDGPGGVG